MTCEYCKDELPDWHIENGKQYGTIDSFVSYRYCNECGRNDCEEQMWRLIARLEKENRELREQIK